MKICQNCIDNNSIPIEWQNQEIGDCAFCKSKDVDVIDIDY